MASSRSGDHLPAKPFGRYFKNRFFALLSASCGLFLIMTFPLGCDFFGPKKYVIGYVNPNPEEKEGAQGFLRNMPAFGYTEGKNVTYIKCESNDKKVIHDAIKDMVAKRVDLIFTMTTPATKMAQELTKETNIPVVFILYDALASGVVESLTSPGGNLTGVQLCGSAPKTVEWLLAVTPGVERVVSPVKFDTGAARQCLEDFQKSVVSAGLKFSIIEVSTVEDLRARLFSLPKDTGAVFVPHSWLIGSHLGVIIDALKSSGILILSAGHVTASDGVTLSYAPEDNSIGKQVARLSHNILRGAPPSSLPVENADFSLGINMRTAEATGIDMPEKVLRNADYVIRSEQTGGL